MLTSADILFYTMTVGTGPGTGETTLPLPVPDNPALIGRTRYAQWALVDVLANTLG